MPHLPRTSLLLVLLAPAMLAGCFHHGLGGGEPATVEAREAGLAKDVVRPPDDQPRSDPRGRALAVLRAALDRARAARPEEHVTTGPVDATVLVGMSRSAIVRALGTPGQCRVAPQTICDPNMRPVQCREEMRAQPAPCTSGTDLFYSFYHLPQGWRGGGPELLLRFQGERCIAAEWQLTE